MSTPTPHTDVDLRLPDEDPAEAVGNPLDAISWPVRTDRLSLRPATRDDLEATWRFRRLDTSVSPRPSSSSSTGRSSVT
jgi:hypothetical protein